MPLFRPLRASSFPPMTMRPSWMGHPNGIVAKRKTENPWVGHPPQVASNAGKLSYVGPFSTCVTYCVRGLNVAGVNGKGAIHAVDPLSMIPNYFAWWLSTTADSQHTEKVTVTIRPAQ